MIKRILIFLSAALLFLLSGRSPVFVPPIVVPWNEEKTDSLGDVVSAHSLGETHTTIHYDLTKLLALKSGLSADTSEILARYCALVDQINPQSGYPYKASLNSTSIPDTFPGWRESIAGTERGGLNNNTQNEFTAQFWHFPFRDPSDTLTGQMVWGMYPVATNFRHFTGPPHFWRVPITYNLKHIMEWALYNGGQPGLPDPLTPVEVKFTDANMRARKHADACIQAIWRALREFKRVHHITNPALYIMDNNGFQDGDGIAGSAIRNILSEG